eukprot:scaffold118056_cov43-Prasinocladus_malaysianus.AAC.1
MHPSGANWSALLCFNPTSMAWNVPRVQPLLSRLELPPKDAQNTTHGASVLERSPSDDATDAEAELDDFASLEVGRIIEFMAPRVFWLCVYGIVTSGMLLVALDKGEQHNIASWTGQTMQANVLQGRSCDEMDRKDWACCPLLLGEQHAATRDGLTWKEIAMREGPGRVTGAQHWLALNQDDEPENEPNNRASADGSGA